MNFKTAKKLCLNSGHHMYRTTEPTLILAHDDLKSTDWVVMDEEGNYVKSAKISGLRSDATVFDDWNWAKKVVAFKEEGREWLRIDEPGLTTYAYGKVDERGVVVDRRAMITYVDAKHWDWVSMPNGIVGELGREKTKEMAMGAALESLIKHSH